MPKQQTGKQQRQQPGTSLHRASESVPMRRRSKLPEEDSTSRMREEALKAHEQFVQDIASSLDLKCPASLDLVVKDAVDSAAPSLFERCTCSSIEPEKGRSESIRWAEEETPLAELLVQRTGLRVLDTCTSILLVNNMHAEVLEAATEPAAQNLDLQSGDHVVQGDFVHILRKSVEEIRRQVGVQKLTRTQRFSLKAMDLALECTQSTGGLSGPFAVFAACTTNFGVGMFWGLNLFGRSTFGNEARRAMSRLHSEWAAFLIALFLFLFPMCAYPYMKTRADYYTAADTHNMRRITSFLFFGVLLASLVLCVTVRLRRHASTAAHAREWQWANLRNIMSILATVSRLRRPIRMGWGWFFARLKNK